MLNLDTRYGGGHLLEEVGEDLVLLVLLASGGGLLVNLLRALKGPVSLNCGEQRQKEQARNTKLSTIALIAREDLRLSGSAGSVKGPVSPTVLVPVGAASLASPASGG